MDDSSRGLSAVSVTTPPHQCCVRYTNRQQMVYEVIAEPNSDRCCVELTRAQDITAAAAIGSHRQRASLLLPPQRVSLLCLSHPLFMTLHYKILPFSATAAAAAISFIFLQGD